MARPNRRRQGGRGSARSDAHSSTRQSGPWPRWCGALLLAWVAVTYAPSLVNGFTYDDPSIVAEASRLLSDPSLLGRLATPEYFRLSNESTYRPIVTLTYIIDWHIGGGAPWAFHLQSILWHLVAVGLLLVLLRRLGASDPIRYSSALLYGVHPALTEAVDAIAFREDVLVTAFGLLGLVVVTGDRPRPPGIRLILAAIAFAAALFSKESAVVFLVLVPLTTWAAAKGRGDSWEPLRYRLEFLTVALTTAAYLLIRFGLLPAHESYGSRIGGSLAASLATGAVAIAYYGRLLLYPIALCADYRGVLAFVTSAADWRLWLSIGALAAATIVGWRWRQERPLAWWGWLWFLTALAPVSNVVPIPAFMAERFLHLPFVGVVVFAVVLPNALAVPRIAPRAIISVTLGLALLLSALTWRRHDAWRSDENLWQRTLLDYPTAQGALHGYGSALIREHRYADGVAYLRRLLDDPTIGGDRRAAVAVELASVYDTLGETDAARSLFEEAIAAADAPRARLGLALIYFRLDRLDDAKDQLDQLLRVQPDDPQARSVLGGVLSRQGREQDALVAWGEAIRLDPTIASAHANIGVTLGKTGRLDEGIAALQTALTLEPRQAQWHVALANLLVVRGRSDLAAEHLREALKIDPAAAQAKEALQALSTK